MKSLSSLNLVLFLKKKLSQLQISDLPNETLACVCFFRIHVWLHFKTTLDCKTVGPFLKIGLVQPAEESHTHTVLHSKNDS